MLDVLDTFLLAYFLCFESCVCLYAFNSNANVCASLLKLNGIFRFHSARSQSIRLGVCVCVCCALKMIYLQIHGNRLAFMITIPSKTEGNKLSRK